MQNSQCDPFFLKIVIQLHFWGRHPETVCGYDLVMFHQLPCIVCSLHLTAAQCVPCLSYCSVDDNIDAL